MEAFMKEFQHLVIQLEEIKSATNNFDAHKVIGAGGFGKVYRGELTHFEGRSMVAIKRLDRTHGQGNSEFWKEIMMLSRFKHKNLISLLGFCDEDGEKILVYEYASNGSLDRHLNSPSLTWIQRINICIDAARGLGYLHDHNGGQQRVLHRDIKSSNILLDENWNAKVSDMGLARIGPANQHHTFQVTNAVGTFGYLDPQYMERGILTKESDVYSFGVVLSEVLFGRLCYENINGSISILVHMWKDRYKKKKLDEIIFRDLMRQGMDSYCLKTFSDIAFHCLKRSSEKRPTMAYVVERLEIALQFQMVTVDDDLNLTKEYVEVLRAAIPPLVYRSLEDLKMLLSRGVLINQGKRWFSINANGEHFEMVSTADCLITDKIGSYKYLKTSKYNSRFAHPCYESYSGKFRAHVKTQFLSPLVTYTVNLVFKFSRKEKTFSKLRYIGLKYKLEDDSKSSVGYFADERDDGWVMLELYQFTSNGSSIDLKIQFQGSRYYYPSTIIEGIEFRPLENVEHEDENVDSELDWEQKLPNDYQDIIELLEDDVQWKTNEELYSLLWNGFRIKNGVEWFFLGKHGRRCYMLPAGAVLKETQWSWGSLTESRSKVDAFDPVTKCVHIECQIKTPILSPQETYACYLVYKLPIDHSDLKAPLKVRDKDFNKEDWEDISYNHTPSRKKGWEETDYRFIFLVRPPQTPVIRLQNNQNHDNQSLISKHKLKGLPRLRNDGWMEVQVWEFQTGSSTEMIWMRIDLVSSINIRMKGLIVKGIEFRPKAS